LLGILFRVRKPQVFRNVHREKTVQIKTEDDDIYENNQAKHTNIQKYCEMSILQQQEMSSVKR